MRLHALELTGFGPFRETQRVDFDAFGDDGVFLISGRTGTGKSSILDGVCFALYGTVPRYEGGDKRLRSDHSFLTDPTEVRLEFTIGDARWRVTRAPDYDRPAKRGGGLTTEPARAELEELVGDVWVGRAAKPREVGIALGELLGLNAQQFQQVILLAQNKFSRFLLAPGDERQTLLRTLFGTRRFEQYRDDLEQRRREAQRQHGTVSEHARTLLTLAERLVDERGLGGETGDARETHESEAARDVDAAGTAPTSEISIRRDALVAAQQRADYRVEQAATARRQADEAHAAAASAHASLRERAQRGHERAVARDRLEALEQRAPEIAAQRDQLARARAAEALRAPIDAVARAAGQHARAAEAAAEAEEVWIRGGGEAADDVPARIDELTAQIARWQDAAQYERAHDALALRVAELTASLAEIDGQLAALDERISLVPARRTELDDAIAAARASADRQSERHRRHAELSDQLAAARESLALADASAAADRAHLVASTEASVAAAAVTQLLQRRLAGYAGELASALVDGSPCAVCGSTSHPHPAEAAPDVVTDEDLAAAERERDRAHGVADSAAAAARTARERLSAAQARAGGQSEMALAEAVAAARVEADAADAAAGELDALAARRAELDDLVAGADAERRALAERRGAERDAQVAAAAEATAAEALITAARGSFGTVAARLAAGEAERARARSLAEARLALAEHARALAAVEADLRARLAANGAGSVYETRSALRSPAEIAELEAEIQAHTAELSATRSRLLELELETVGDDVTDDDLALSATALDAADQARAAAIAAERDAQNAATSLRDLAQQADAAYADVADVADDAASITRLADTVAGRAPNTMKMDLETFVLAAELEEIVAAASVRLAEMSSGRYTLHHSDARASRGRASGLGIDVLDAHTGKLRSPQSLSGGETFLASLALALGLGEVVTSRAGGIRLDTLFVDEGFGSLDPETLDLAMRTLDELRAGGRTVGVISHVEAMKEQLPAQLIVEATPEGPSIIRQDSAAIV